MKRSVAEVVLVLMLSAGMAAVCVFAQRHDGEAEEFSVPELPESGQGLSDFVPEGWELMDSAELDFNRDGITDYVGVQQAADRTDERYPDWRILFAIASDGFGQYRLDFCDINLIRTRTEGGIMGDPYLPLEAEGTSFTTNSAGGSAWKWWESYTYTYKENNWYLTLAESDYGYGAYTTEYKKDDWESGVGIRKKRSSDFEDMEKHQEEDDPAYDMEYEISLDEAPTLRQASMNWWLSTERVTDWEVTSIKIAEGIGLDQQTVTWPREISLFDYSDEDCVIYEFGSSFTGYYVAMYRRDDKILSILARESGEIENLKLYQGKIYYSTALMEHVAYKTERDGSETVAQGDYALAIRLNRVDVDGANKETVFEYRYPGEEKSVERQDHEQAGRKYWQERPPYLSAITEISGDEIVVEVYVTDEAHPVYRMNVDGSGCRLIGQIPKEE